MKRLLSILLIVCLFIPTMAWAEESEDDTPNIDENTPIVVYDTNGALIFSRIGGVYVDDEYISGDNKYYRVVEVKDDHTAIAEYLGEEKLPELAYISPSIMAFAPQNNQKKLIAMYCTHSDESYVPTDGTSSNDQHGGIYDVAGNLKKELESKGVEVILDTTTHLPHDAGAYRRSRQTATDLMKKAPAALIDIHRDGIPAPEEYTKEIDGKNATMVRLLVGRSNPNSAANKEFAKKIKAVADKEYPGLIKDIFIGKGSYNQELLPQSILLEFGTHTIKKERAIESTAFMANVLTTTLFGTTAKAESSEQAPASQSQNDQTTEQRASGAAQSGAAQSNTNVKTPAKKNGVATGIAWVIGLLVVGAIGFTLLQTGSFKGAMEKVRGNASEVTGGLIKRKDEDDK